MKERDQRELEAIAPTAPSARYTFADSSSSQSFLAGGLASPRVRLVALAVAALALAGVAILLAARKPSDPVVTLPNQAVAGEPTIRRVIVPLPFAAKRVTLPNKRLRGLTVTCTPGGKI